MADNESVDVNIASGVNGDSLEHDNFTEKKTESYAAVVRGDDHHNHHSHHHHNDHHLKARIEELERENEGLKAAEAEREQEGKAMESITKRAFQLEGEVVRLQHDLGTAMNAGDEAGREIERMSREIDELRREKSALSEKIEDLKRSESVSGSKISELEKKIQKLEESEREVRREKAAAEDQAKARLDELGREITQVKKEKTLVEAAMGTLEAELKNSEAKVIQMSGRIEQLAKNTEESEVIIAGMAEKATQRGIDGIAEAGESDGGFLKSKISISVAGTVSAGVVVAALAVCYVRFSRTRLKGLCMWSCLLFSGWCGGGCYWVDAAFSLGKTGKRAGLPLGGCCFLGGAEVVCCFQLGENGLGYPPVTDGYGQSIPYP